MLLIHRFKREIFHDIKGDFTSKLFRNEKDPIEIIKWKEIYQILENTIDKCEKIANTVEGVVIKNA